ncbi:MAG: aminomethyl-transferring glycine dehydrogenase subunit GcvPA [Acidimicrobiia bacterium]|nr:aminomethyl-transferring glycine dehydrogenase subunit GcvPA [Acidimicrobiia bacterium]
MNYVPHTDAERQAMMAAVGVSRLEELFDGLPENLRFPRLDLPEPVSELEIEREMAELAGRNSNAARSTCFLGAGSYRHYIPATVDAVLGRSEFYTSYTPYQPELSQGMLQATFEYQSMICALTGMDVSTASHYDGATALAEAVLLALAVGGGRRRTVIAPATVHPQYRQVLRTYLQGSDASLVGDDTSSFDLDHLMTRLEAGLDDEVAACVIQSPNFFGRFEPVAELARRVHDAGAMLIVIADPIALGLFRPPGEDGADVVVADGQPLGIPLSFGGPHLGILATKQEFVRRTAGRLVGETVDVHGQRGYVLTLSTREQHIRRERATSNICTNAALMALAAAVYLATVGRSGLATIAEHCYHKSHYAAAEIGRLPGFDVNPDAPDQPYFKEFVARLPLPVAEANRRLQVDYDIIGGYDLGRDYPGLDDHMLLAVTEMNTRDDIDRLVTALAAIAETPSGQP